jgi:hypothetical protein
MTSMIHDPKRRPGDARTANRTRFNPRLGESENHGDGACPEVRKGLFDAPDTFALLLVLGVVALENLSSVLVGDRTGTLRTRTRGL